MTLINFHPAIFQLLRLQSRGRRRRIWQRSRQPRRIALSAVACVLAIVWLGNAVLTVWLREAASVETLRGLLSLGFATYAAWHLAKAAFFRPEAPFDWAPAERDVLAMLPLESRDLVAYQLASVTITTSIKTAIFAVLLLPDLRCVAFALIGLFLAMMMLEIFRMAVEIATWGMSRAAYLTYRAATVMGIVVCGLVVTDAVFREAGSGGQINLGEGLLQRLLDLLLQSNASVFSYAAAPFHPFIDLIVADEVSVSDGALAIVAVGIVLVFANSVIRLYTAMARRVAERERSSYCTTDEVRLGGRSGQNELGRIPNGNSVPSLRRIPRWGGAGALLWRQLVGARRCWSSHLTAMIAPAILACAPCFVIADPHIALLATAATLAFYTFLLLPTAVRFDFRRDLDRIGMFKGLPIASAAAVIGQTIAPILIATLFQTVVIAFAVLARSLPLHHLFSTMLVMLPINALVFSLDNLVFLLYPYRIQQEGLEIFFRTMLTFTGKGLLFAIGLGAMSGWGFAAAALTRGLSQWTGFPINAFAVFAVGMIAGPLFLAALVLYALCRTYHQLDPIEDLPR